MKNSKSIAVKNVICIVIIIATYLYLLLNWSNIPNKIPGHYGAAGAIDRWGSKGELWILPVFMVLIFCLISTMERFPQVWNTGVSITEENKERVYHILKNMIVTTKLVCCALFSFITINSSLASPLPNLFLPVTLILMFGTIGYYMFYLYKEK